jgi:hypothetical protein
MMPNCLQRYDVVSAMMGSLLVTTLAVAHGQSLATAAGLTIMSTVMALVRFTPLCVAHVWLPCGQVMSCSAVLSLHLFYLEPN